MGKLNTKDIKAGGEGGVPKTLQPGNHKCTINSVTLETFKFKEDSYHIVLHVEGPDMGPEFEGFFIDKNNEAKGRHKGQVGRVKASEWAYADSKTVKGIVISRDAEMLKFLKNLCVALGCGDWLLNEDGKHDTIESLFKQFDKDKPFKGVVLDYCFGGKEYVDKNGYNNYDLFLPKYSKAGPAYGVSRVVTFNEAEHIKKKKTESVSEFGSDDNTISGPASSDFQLD
jgi:hypothetical protein